MSKTVQFADGFDAKKKSKISASNVFFIFVTVFVFCGRLHFNGIWGPFFGWGGLENHCIFCRVGGVSEDEAYRGLRKNWP